MPRQARAKSSTGIYHCILRGVDKRDIFLDDQDRYKFLKEIKNAKEKYDFALYAYCLMNNHVHLLIKENQTNLGMIMHYIGFKYSMYFNLKYQRVGHLFQNRYISKPVETEAYLLTVQKYIHQNPPYMQTYKWSSYGEYVCDERKITDTKFILGMFAQETKKAINEFRQFTCRKSNKISIEEYKDCELVKNVPDEKVIKVISNMLNIDNILEIKKYNTVIRNKYIKDILQIDGITIGQISRIMEIDKKTLSLLKNK